MILVLKNNNFIKFEGDIINLPPDVSGCPAIKCDYIGGGRYYFRKYVNFGNWNVDDYGNLQDCRQEVRNFSYPEEILEIVKNFNSWLEYDASQREKAVNRILSEKESLEKKCLVLEEELNEIKSKLRDLCYIIKIIYDINEKGGVGSRKKVRELTARHVLVCNCCNKADCVCEK